jgi:uncharacterized protein YbaR (Trm112 family)
MAKVKFEIPGKDTPGFLLRQKKLMEFLACPDDAPDKWVLMVDLLMEYVVSPQKREAAEKALWELSENEYNEAMELIGRQAEVDPNI